jgi:hypothetical protein
MKPLGDKNYQKYKIGVVRTSVYAEAEDMICDADTAVYRAKDQGNARYEIFDTAMHTHADLFILNSARADSLASPTAPWLILPCNPPVKILTPDRTAINPHYSHKNTTRSSLPFRRECVTAPSCFPVKSRSAFHVPDAPNHKRYILWSPRTNDCR